MSSRYTATVSTRPQRILVVDDEESLRHMCGVILRRAGYEVLSAKDGMEALAVLDAHPDLRLVLCDVRMPRLDGLGFLDAIAQRSEPIYTVVMSAYGSMDLAMEAMKRGATDYIGKPFKPDEILLVLGKVQERERLTQDNARLRAQLQAQLRGRDVEGLVGTSPPMQALAETLRKVAGYPSTVLITGESGSGKERVARSLHALSDRADAPFVAVNCGAIPENLLESELFGHVRGAFTGAIREHPGLFEQADGGTLLLDELGEMPKTLQVKLLRVLQEQVLRRVGGSKDIQVDVRVVGATARDLEREVAAGRFRDDLYYRLNVVHLKMPPLRARTEDLPALVEHFIDSFNLRFDKRVSGLEPDALRRLMAYDWPGNVRELENVVERAMLLAEGNILCSQDLPEFRARVDGDSEDLSIKSRSATLERGLIQQALARTEGNRSQAAKLLEISYKALVYKIRDYGLE
jgi:two-component system response regulator AtoC